MCTETQTTPTCSCCGEPLGYSMPATRVTCDRALQLHNCGPLKGVGEAYGKCYHIQVVEKTVSPNMCVTCGTAYQIQMNNAMYPGQGPWY